MINWLVAGIGDITTKRVIPAIQSEPRSNLHSLLTRTPAKAADYPDAKIYTDLQTALADKAVDAVYVGLPVALHAPVTLAALAAGKHVLCEKPTAMNYEEALTMVEAAHTAQRVFGVAYYRRMYPKLRRAAELLKQGVIGLPVLAEANSHSWFEEIYSGGRNWFTDPALAGGGPLYDIASHRIDAFNYLFGVPKRVTGQISNLVKHSPVEDNASLMIEYESGVRGLIDVRWHSRIPRDDFRIIGTDGAMELSPLNGPDLTYCGIHELHPAPANLHYPCVENFVSSVLDGTPLASSGQSAIVTDWVTAQVMANQP